MRNASLRFLFALLLLLAIVGAHADPDPNRPTPPVELVQARVLRNLNLQDFTLEGVIRSPKQVHPMRLRTREREMVFEFLKQPLQLRVLLSPVETVVFKRANSSGEWQALSGKERLSPILDTDATYEDLSLDFIRWSNVISLGSDSIKTLPAWAFEAEPDGPSQYAKVRYWISSQYFAFLRVDGYGADGTVKKRVEVNGVQRIGEAYVIKEMQVSTLVPGRELSRSRTYIEVRTGQPGSGL